MSNFVYHYDSVWHSDNTIIALKYVESMTLPESDESDIIIDRLKSDLFLMIRTVSGKEYTLSMKSITDHLNFPQYSKEQVRTAIYNKWCSIVR